MGLGMGLNTVDGCSASGITGSGVVLGEASEGGRLVEGDKTGGGIDVTVGIGGGG